MMRILAAVDLTPQSNLVISAAAALAETMGAGCGLVHVVVPATPFAEMPGMSLTTGDDTARGLIESAREQLAVLAEQLHPDRRDGSSVEVGSVAETVLRVAADEQAELVVIGAHGHGALSRALGTTAASIVNRAHGPVLVVRRRAGAVSSTLEPRRVLAAVDSSVMAGQVVSRAVALAQVPGARVRLLRVDPDRDPLAQLATGSSDELRRLEAEVPAERRDGTAILRGDAVTQICAYAREYGADVVVVGAHAHGWLARVLGTTAAAVVDRIDRPLFVVHNVKQVPSRLELRAEHARLEQSYRSILHSFESGDWAHVQSRWAVLESALRAHMAFEDDVYFRRYSAAVVPFPMEAAAALENQHAELRNQLDRFAFAVEVHSVVQRDAEEMVATVQRHAAREETVFARWLDGDHR